MKIYFLKYNETSLYQNSQEPQFFPLQTGSFSYRYYSTSWGL